MSAKVREETITSRIIILSVQLKCIAAFLTEEIDTTVKKSSGVVVLRGENCDYKNAKLCYF
jgi:hypothetical protein